MGLREFFLWQLEHEAAATRAVIERIPEGRNRWTPHIGGLELGQLATLVATMQGMVALLISRRVLNVEGSSKLCLITAPHACRGEWLQLLVTGLARSRQALEETTEEHLLGMVRFRQNGQVVSEGPRYAMIAESAFAQQAHHRGALAVYLDMLDAQAKTNRYAAMVTEKPALEVRTSLESVKLRLSATDEPVDLVARLAPAEPERAKRCPL